jgi:alanyl-tRNA synthetase
MLGTLHVHVVEMSEGSLTTNDQIKIKIDQDRRRQLRAHHSATHLLHGALRKFLGSQVNQKGSLVAQDRLRFDFTHTKPLTNAELDLIEQDINRQILENSPVQTHLMSPEEATKKGAMALFEEKYGDEVRVLSMGTDGDHPYSVELCGGTHVHHTGDIGLFKILSESGVSAGIRRIEAIAGDQSYRFVRDLQRQMTGLTDLLKCPVSEASDKLSQILQERKSFERQLSEMRQKLALSGDKSGGTSHSGASPEPKIIGNIKVITRQLQEIPAKDLKPLADQLKVDIDSGIVILTSVIEGKVALVIGVTSDLTGRISAVDLVKEGAEALGGKGGGGRTDMAQAGGNDPALIDHAFKAIEKAISKG